MVHSGCSPSIFCDHKFFRILIDVTHKTGPISNKNTEINKINTFPTAGDLRAFSTLIFTENLQECMIQGMEFLHGVWLVNHKFF